MKSFPFIASLEQSHRLTRGSTNVERLRDIILTDHLYSLSGWNKGNFKTTIYHFDLPKYAIIVVSVYEHSPSGEMVVYLDSGETYAFIDLLTDLQSRSLSLSFLFVYCSSQYVEKINYLLRLYVHYPIYAVVAATDPWRILFAIGCELANFWNLRSIFKDEVDFNYISLCADQIIRNYAECRSIDFCPIIFDSSKNSISRAWSGGILYASKPDIVTIRDNARVERVTDTIKRIFDSAASPRALHYTTDERMICTQGLFWLSELAAHGLIDVKDWTIATQLSNDLRLPLVNSSNTDACQPRHTPDMAMFHRFLSSFILIPAGKYSIGINDSYANSEPPAPKHDIHATSFKILGHPVTNAEWNAIIASPVKEGEEDYPVVNVSYFECKRFAEIASQLLQSNRGADRGRISLPNEYQWEIAAGGPNHHNYPWGPLFGEMRCNCEMRVGRPTVVGKYSPDGDSAFGCVDMAGNIREWTTSYAGTDGIDLSIYPVPSECLNRLVVRPFDRMIIRGGSYSYDADCVQTWVRNTQIAIRRDRQTGFRAVWEQRNGE